MSEKFISIEELHPIYQNLKEDELIVDVRTDEEFAEGHVPGSDQIPFEKIAEKVDQYKEYSTVYIYCRRGGRAQKACEILESQGLENLVCVSDGGMDRWIEAGFPVEE